MIRVQINRPGRYDALKLVESPDLEPTDDEVLLNVEAIGVNYADSIVRMGLYASARELHGYPITPGFEVAGRVAAVGRNVSGWTIGERALGVTLFGGYASQICLTTERLFKLGPTLSLDQAAGLPTVFLTAWFCIDRLAHVESGEVALVHSAAGGVGSALVQLLKQRGATVIGVVGAAHKVATARAQGCDQVIDKSTAPLWRRARELAPAGFHHVFDANGVSTLRESFEHLKPMGKLVLYGFHSMLPKTGGWPNWPKLAWDWLRTPRFSPLEMTQVNKSVLACNLSFLSAESALLRRGMLELLAQFESGALKPLPVTCYRLAQVADAQRAIESGQTVGKLILKP
jgi:synaptic vesicle membrane protein VAT-1